MDRIDPAYFNYAEISILGENLFFVNPDGKTKFDSNEPYVGN